MVFVKWKKFGRRLKGFRPRDEHELWLGKG